MLNSEKIKTAFERQSKAVELRPGIGQNTAVTKIRVVNGLSCEVEEGSWKLKADMGEKWGGNNTGPNPGVYGRTALGTCIAEGYIMWASRLGIPIEELEVEIEADYDTRGACGLDGISPGYKEIRYNVFIKSPEPEEKIKELLDFADKRTPYLDVFRNPMKVKRVDKICK